MNEKPVTQDSIPADSALQTLPTNLQPTLKPAVFTVKLRVTAPLDHLIAQLYRAWPKPRARKDN